MKAICVNPIAVHVHQVTSIRSRLRQIAICMKHALIATATGLRDRQANQRIEVRREQHFSERLRKARDDSTQCIAAIGDTPAVEISLEITKLLLIALST